MRNINKQANLKRRQKGFGSFLSWWWADFSDVKGPAWWYTGQRYDIQSWSSHDTEGRGSKQNRDTDGLPLSRGIDWHLLKLIYMVLSVTGFIAKGIHTGYFWAKKTCIFLRQYRNSFGFSITSPWGKSLTISKMLRTSGINVNVFSLSKITLKFVILYFYFFTF